MTGVNRIDGRTNVDGELMPAGPWDSEPDHVDFRSAHGVPCIIHRNGIGAWCGYVAVPPGHPWHGVPYDEIGAVVHGGLTYGSACNGSVCHVPEPGEPDDVWWVGFDCCHLGDVSPWSGHPSYPSKLSSQGEYRDMEYAMSNTLALAAQAHAAGGYK